MKVPVFRTPYNYDSEAVSLETGLACNDPSLAIQSARDEVDINTIVARFGLGEALPEGMQMPQYADVEGLFDLQSLLNHQVAAREAFHTLPAGVRARFQHNPLEFVDFCSREDNLPEMRRMGLAKPLDASPVDSSALSGSMTPVGSPSPPKGS